MADTSLDRPINVYKVTCCKTGKGYVGVTLFPLQVRWKGHVEAALRRTRTGALQRAIVKYGPDAFTIELLEVALGRDAACAAERQQIEKQRTKAPQGYNMTDGGEWEAGFKLSDVLREQRAENARAFWESERGQAMKLRYSLNLAGRRMAPEFAETSRIGMKLVWASGKRARTQSPETVQKRAAAIKASWASPEVRAARIAGLQAAADRRGPVVVSEETRRRMSESGKARAARDGVNRPSEDGRRRISEARKAYWAARRAAQAESAD